MLAYDKDELVDYGVFDEAQAEKKGTDGDLQAGHRSIWLTFRGKTGKAMEWMSATSFTSRNQAVTNLNAETYYVRRSGLQQYDGVCCPNLVGQRLHTIDVESQDTAKVNRFYTALYRFSPSP